MIRIIFMLITAALAAHMQLRAEEPDSFDIEPPLLNQNLADEPLPGARATDVDAFEKRLERAKKNAAGAERLCKIGVLSKVEVEQLSLKVVRCECDLANARLARAKEECAARETQAALDKSIQNELQTARAALAQATEAAQLVAAKRARAELDVAEANLRRQQKLLKLGSAKKSDVDRAEEKLADLKAHGN